MAPRPTTMTSNGPDTGLPTHAGSEGRGGGQIDFKRRRVEHDAVDFEGVGLAELLVADISLHERRIAIERFAPAATTGQDVSQDVAAVNAGDAHRRQQLLPRPRIKDVGRGRAASAAREPVWRKAPLVRTDLQDAALPQEADLSDLRERSALLAGAARVGD